MLSEYRISSVTVVVYFNDLIIMERMNTFLFYPLIFVLEFISMSKYYSYAQFIQNWTTEIIKKSISVDLYIYTNKVIAVCSHRFVGRRNRCMASFILRTWSSRFLAITYVNKLLLLNRLIDDFIALSKHILECSIFIADIKENKFTGDILCET